MTTQTIQGGTRLDSLFSLVKNNYRFRYVEDDQLAGFLSLFGTISYPKGSHVFMEGDETGWFYFVISGRIEIHVSNHKFTEKIFNILGPGNALGLSEMFNCHGVHTSSALCEEDCVLASIPRSRFRSVILDYPSVTYAICVYMGNMIGQLRHELTFSNVETRLLSYLKNYLPTGKREKDGHIHIPRAVTFDKLAGMLNIARETISRIFRDLKKRGIVEARNGSYVILDEEAVEEAVPWYSCLPKIHDPGI
ncbi:MAG: Crp/Fnr family transcriptional regulator [Spirochaetales bacterium]|nr:Crp/Fnr family transcriptional regulator [Spirochaetales bacterium]